ncbi:hypothetical protein [Lichenicoccus roseus]|nr:hypothetical protein [Lichenicoccus roseus]
MNTLVKPLSPAISIRNVAIIYGLTAASCFLVNIVVERMPIGDWGPADISKMFWLDNVTWQLLSLWWLLLSVVSDGWPFTSVADPTRRALATIASSWVVGWFSAKAIYWTGLGADWVFPIIGTIYFLIAFISFAGENWLVTSLPPARKFFILFSLIAFLTYIITNSTIRWIPAWWFPFIEMGLASGLLAYLTRGVRQPGRGVVQIGLLFLVVLAFTVISRWLHVWDFTKAGIGDFWRIGTYTSPYFLLWFMTGCSVSYTLLVQTHNWPFRFVPMPWGGVLSCLACIVVTSAVAWLLSELVGILFASVQEALTYAYMGVNWSFTMALLFGFGVSQPYLWRGQTVPGSWDDVA